MSSSSGLNMFPDGPYKRLKFLHITKTAGTSIEEAAFKSESNEMSVNTNILWGKYDKQLKACAPDNLQFWHLPPKFLDSKTFSSLLQKYDFFVTVRNPYERIVSEYYCEWGGPKTKAEDESHFNRFIYDRLEEVEGLIDGDLKIEGHFTPQYMYIYDQKGKRIVAEQNVVHVEQLQVEFDGLMERYGLGIREKDIGHTNKCAFEKKFTVAHLNLRTINMIQRVYKKDFELFGYSLAPEDSKNGPIKALVESALATADNTTSDAAKSDKQDMKNGSADNTIAATAGADTVEIDGDAAENKAGEEKPTKKQKV